MVTILFLRVVVPCLQICWERLQGTEGALVPLRRRATAGDRTALRHRVQQEAVRAAGPNTDILHPLCGTAGKTQHACKHEAA